MGLVPRAADKHAENTKDDGAIPRDPLVKAGILCRVSHGSTQGKVDTRRSQPHNGDEERRIQHPRHQVSSILHHKQALDQEYNEQRKRDELQVDGHTVHDQQQSRHRPVERDGKRHNPMQTQHADQPEEDVAERQPIDPALAEDEDCRQSDNEIHGAKKPQCRRPRLFHKRRAFVPADHRAVRLFHLPGRCPHGLQRPLLHRALLQRPSQRCGDSDDK
mmetsp:Transcript_32740/g.85698  ORF Transcript_32740/g.85698 Transcript_32740/m.85698 type:complete len:218 (+) Transcript_32740:627-1280(+)